MRKSMFTAGLLGLALAVAVPASAERGPGVEEAGPTGPLAPVGLVLNPTAYTLPAGQWLIGGGAFTQTVMVGGASRSYSLGVFRGLKSDLQVGAFWTNVRLEQPGVRDRTRNFLGGAGQWMFVPETRSMPAISVGGDVYTGFGTGGTAYLVASKNLTGSIQPGAIFAHLGLRYDGWNNGSGIRPFVGADYLLTDNLSLNGEWRPHYSWEHNDVYAVGASYAFARSFVVSAGVENLGFHQAKLYAGLSVAP